MLDFFFLKEAYVTVGDSINKNNGSELREQPSLSMSIKCQTLKNMQRSCFLLVPPQLSGGAFEAGSLVGGWEIAEEKTKSAECISGGWEKAGVFLVVCLVA